MKKLLIVTDNFLPRWDGIARFIMNLLPSLKEDYQVTIACPAFDGSAPQIPDVKIVRFPLVRIQFGDIYFSSWNWKRMRHLVKEHDLVFNQALGPLGMSAIRAAKKERKYLVSYVHSIDWELASKSLRHFRQLTWLGVKFMARYFYNQCSLLLVPSAEVGEVLHMAGITTKKIVVPLGVNTVQFVPPVSREQAKRAVGLPSSVSVISYVGRLGREKNLLTLYNAFQKLRKEVKNTVLVVVGAGLHDEIRPDSRVIMVGQQNDPLPYYQATDIYVLPSLTETTSFTTLEAMACGCSVIATPVGSVREYIEDGVNGLIFPRRDVKTLSEQLLFLLTHPTTRVNLGQEARKTVEQKRSWANSIVQIKNALRK